MMRKYNWLSACLFLLLPLAAHAQVTNLNTSVSFSCTGSIGPYPFTFPISDATALTVIQNGTTLASTAYTIKPVNNQYENGGSVTLNAACGSGTLVLQRITPLTQLSIFRDNMPVPYKTFQYGLDKLTEIDQEIAKDLENITVGGGVTTLNGLSGAVTLAAGTNVTLSITGNTITVNSSGGGGGSPGGSPGQVQFNSSGVFGGSPNFTWNGVSLGILGSTSVSTTSTGAATSVTGTCTTTSALCAGGNFSGSSSGNGSFTSIDGIYAAAGHAAVTALPILRAGYFQNSTQSGAGTVTNSYGWHVDVPTFASGVTVTNGYGGQIEDQCGTPAPTNCGGLHIAAQSNGAFAARFDSPITLFGATSGSMLISMSNTGGTLNLAGGNVTISSGGIGTFSVLVDSGLIGSGNRCVYADSTGTLQVALSACGAGGGGSVFPVTVSGTVNSGGIPCFTSTTNEASSAAITAGYPIVGGGAGACITGVQYVPLANGGTGTGTGLAFNNLINATATNTFSIANYRPTP